MDKKILIPNAAMLIDSMRSIGYSFETAVADIVDNSIYARATEIRLVHQIFGKDPYFAILDNGVGMTFDELQNAMVYGAKNPNDVRDENDLGRFGLGMKSASMSQCRNMLVISKKNGTLNGFSWDLDYVIETQEWASKSFTEKDIKKFKNKEIKELIGMESVAPK